MNKHLNALGKGDFDYDYKNDTLFFKIKDREYEKSIEFDDFVVDVDKEGFITGIQIFGASKMFNVAKIELRNVRHFGFETKAESNVITIKLQFQLIRRVMQTNLVRESTDSLADSVVKCTVPA